MLYEKCGNFQLEDRKHILKRFGVVREILSRHVSPIFPMEQKP